MSNIERTLAFIDHWNEVDLDAIIDAVEDSIIYHNIPMDVVTGKDAFRAAISPLLQLAKAVEWETPLIAETGCGAVLTERTDTFVLTSGDRITVRVMGVFEWAASGKLAEWRDYFDLAEFQNQMPG